MKRFVAEWISDYSDERPRYRQASAATFEDARDLAVKEGRKAGVCEWIGIREEEWVGDKRCGLWAGVASWTGDYDQVEEACA